MSKFFCSAILFVTRQASFIAPRNFFCEQKHTYSGHMQFHCISKMFCSRRCMMITFHFLYHYRNFISFFSIKLTLEKILRADFDFQIIFFWHFLSSFNVLALLYCSTTSQFSALSRTIWYVMMKYRGAKRQLVDNFTEKIARIKKNKIMMQAVKFLYPLFFYTSDDFFSLSLTHSFVNCLSPIHLFYTIAQ